jgi:hypothetical protein
MWYNGSSVGQSGIDSNTKSERDIMYYQLPTDSIQAFLNELNLIRRGIHPTVRGSIDCADGFIFRLARNHPIKARAIANRLDYATHVDFHILRVRSFADQIRSELQFFETIK